MHKILINRLLEDLDVLFEYVTENEKLDQDRISNHLLGIMEMYKTRLEILEYKEQAKLWENTVSGEFDV